MVKRRKKKHQECLSVRSLKKLLRIVKVRKLRLLEHV